MKESVTALAAVASKAITAKLPFIKWVAIRLIILTAAIYALTALKHFGFLD
jgi:hypothetical protein